MKFNSSNRESLSYKGKLMARVDGGYPVFYLTKEDDVLCSVCASKEQSSIAAFDVFYEGDSMFCNECSAEIESAYGPVEQEEN